MADCNLRRRFFQQKLFQLPVKQKRLQKWQRRFCSVLNQRKLSQNYRQFVFWVRDSLARRIMAEEVDEEEFSISENQKVIVVQPPVPQ